MANERFRNVPVRVKGPICFEVRHDDSLVRISYGREAIHLNVAEARVLLEWLTTAVPTDIPT